MSERIQIAHDGNGKVILTINGRATILPVDVADRVARGLTRKAREAEELIQVNRIIMDNALMQRAGANIGLSDNPKIKDESIKEALYNRDLRRYLSRDRKDVQRGMGDIQTRGVVGAPSLVKRPHHVG